MGFARRLRQFTGIAMAVCLLLPESGYGLTMDERITAGWVARMMCSSVFVSGRNEQDVLAAEFGPAALGRERAFRVIVDQKAGTVVVAPGVDGERGPMAVYRDGLGCTLALGDVSPAALQDITIPSLAAVSDPDLPWPAGRAIARNAADGQMDRIDALVEEALQYGHENAGLGTRAIAIVYQGRLIAEGYAPTFNNTMPLYGASMTKTVIGMLVGPLVEEGRLSLTRQGLRPGWQDKRATISFEQLLKGVSGLAFGEDYRSDSDVNRMLFTEPDMATYAADKPLEHEPGTSWAYSSGATNILSRLMRDTFASDADWYRYPSWQLFLPLGLETAVFETDTVGTFVGSSFLWASAQDFARLGLLLAQDGKWQGQRVLPEGWVDYQRTAHPGNENANYGAQLWLYPDDIEDRALPARRFAMVGYGGQSVMVAPEDDLVIVRMGWDVGIDPWNRSAFFDSVADALGLR